MAFPFDYSGEISDNSILMSHVEAFQDTFMKKAKESLETAQASVVVHGDEMSFRHTAKLASMFHIKPILPGSVPCGKFVLNRNEGTITYYLNFRKEVIILSLVMSGIFGPLFILSVNGPLILKLVAIMFAWVCTVVGSVYTAIRSFKLAVNRILSEMSISAI